jgi:two-component system, OmpR family, manganese sensing sensor histidine kinase
MFQATRQRLALWYTTVTAVLLLIFAGGMYWYVHSTLVERVDDTLNHVVEVVQRSLVIEPNSPGEAGTVHLNIEASFPDNSAAVEDDHIDLEWFNPQGQLLWSTFSEPPDIPLHPAHNSETIHLPDIAANPSRDPLLRQVTQRIQVGTETLGYLRVSHPWFEVTKPSRELLLDLCLGISAMIGSVAAIGWLLSGLAIAPIRDSYQRLKQFTADASHELRNPVASIQTNVQVALADPEPDVNLQRQQMEVIERLTRRLGRLVDDLLFLARQDSGIVQSQWSALDVRSLLTQILEEQTAVAGRKTIHLGWAEEAPISVLAGDNATSDLSPGLVTADRDQLERLFTNLVSNAIQYTPNAGHVTVSLSNVRKGNVSFIQVVVSDTGVGIATDAIPQLFDRFYRVDPARSRQSAATTNGTSGSGLGLAIAKAIVDHHQGQIRIESEVNQGTTVTVLLPETLASPWPRLTTENAGRI